MKIFIIIQAILVSVTFAQDFVNQVIPALAGTRIVNRPPDSSSDEKCDCKCDSYTFTDSNGGIWGNCQSLAKFPGGHAIGKFCYVSGKALCSCRDVYESSSIVDSYGNPRYYSFEACSTSNNNVPDLSNLGRAAIPTRNKCSSPPEYPYCPTSTNPNPPPPRPIDCKWSDWIRDGDCSKTCGGGIQKWYRNIKVQPRNRGKECTGTQYRENKCNQHACRITFTDTKIACEHSQMELKCRQNNVISVISANYGRINSGTCTNGHSRDIANHNCRSSNALQIVNRYCNGQKSCSISATNSVFGDPCPGTYKYLEVKYECRPKAAEPCYTKITTAKNEWCKDWAEFDEYKNICDGSIADCVSKGKQKCWSDPNCFGITYPYTDNSWLNGKKGVATCQSTEIISKSGEGWNMFMKCDSVPPTQQRLALRDGKFPEVFLNGKWSPICGHWFWDNNHGADLFCQKLDPTFTSGTIIKRRDKPLESDGIRIGKCLGGDQWLGCSGGCNDLGTGNGCAQCAAGQGASVEIHCERPDVISDPQPIPRSCQTVGGPNPGKPCIFPFKWDGRTYTGCPIDIDDSSKRWCSTKVDDRGFHVINQNEYGFCSRNCPNHNDSPDISIFGRSANFTTPLPLLSLSLIEDP